MRHTDEVANERAELRKRYKRAYELLAALLFEEDPIGINFGDNADEYEPEVASILPRLAACRGLSDIQAMVHCVLGLVRNRHCRAVGEVCSGRLAHPQRAL